MLEIIIPIVLAVLYIALLTVAAIIGSALEYLDEADDILIVDPKASKELERIAAKKGSKPHKRFAYDRKSKKAVLVESNRIADELKNEEFVTVDVR